MQSEINLEPECPGLDACPIAFCGCRWLETGSPWAQETPQRGQDHAENDRTAVQGN